MYVFAFGFPNLWTGASGIGANTRAAAAGPVSPVSTADHFFPHSCLLGIAN